jgi:hypothetical protein
VKLPTGPKMLTGVPSGASARLRLNALPVIRVAAAVRRRCGGDAIGTSAGCRRHPWWLEDEVHILAGAEGKTVGPVEDRSWSPRPPRAGLSALQIVASVLRCPRRGAPAADTPSTRPSQSLFHPAASGKQLRCRTPCRGVAIHGATVSLQCR